MSDLVPVPAETAARALIDEAKYQEMYAASVNDPEAFWGEQGKRLDWITPYSTVKNTTYEYPGVSIKWYEDGALNVCANCVDRHLPARADQTAIIWESDDPNVDKHITYAELHEHVAKLGNVLKGLGVAKGDRVILYMPMIPEAAYAMLACARIGAVHSIVFGGFSPDALASRVDDCGAVAIITADEGPRGGRNTPLKANVDKALDILGKDVTTLVVERTGAVLAKDARRAKP
ncbi:MAG: AMP-binding protein, partial [Pseudomonadota bacterium]